ncbi:MAG: hypothetical protein BroJett011_54590 [Chloroflexota bacterium]|nr:MAG: hypothetical protein BroJett011_54590 [Chloroflexota bacterium]
MPHEDDLKKLIFNHQRRLQILEEQSALEGMSADPKILLEIDEIKSKVQGLHEELGKISKSENIGQINVQPLEQVKVETMIWAKDDKEMVRVAAGSFLFGDKKSQAVLPEFWIDRTPVTNAEYYRFVSKTGHRPPPHWGKVKHPPNEIVNHPIVNVSIDDANAYAKWANKRLPTEEEWEKAARGIDGRIYPWGDYSPTPETCNFNLNVGSTTPVGKYSPRGDSPYGCVDMAGNVWEWTTNTLELFIFRPHVFRGGSWYTSGAFLYSSHRNFTAYLSRPYLVGFRCLVVLI